VKAGIAARFRAVHPILGAIEKDVEKDSSCPYLEPTQVSLGEEPKACRVYTKRGNSANQPRTFGIRGACCFSLWLEQQVAVTKGSRLFNKNTGSRKRESV
jgi:hypothetical protein